MAISIAALTEIYGNQIETKCSGKAKVAQWWNIELIQKFACSWGTHQTF